MYELKELKDVLRKRVSFGTYNLKESREVLSEHVRVRTRAVWHVTRVYVYVCCKCVRVRHAYVAALHLPHIQIYIYLVGLLPPFDLSMI